MYWTQTYLKSVKRILDTLTTLEFEESHKILFYLFEKKAYYLLIRFM